MTDAEDPWVEQYTDVSRARLVRAADELAAALSRHTEWLIGLTGGTMQTQEVHTLNDEVRRAAAAWDDAVLDHTGTIPLAVEVLDRGHDDADDDDDTDDEELVEGSISLSVVSRWDLEVDDVPALVEAGRAAHRRTQPEESEEDAQVAIGPAAVGLALYAIAHEAGEPWFDLPGVEVDRAHRAYVSRSDDQVEQEEDEDVDGDDVAPLVLPTGEVLFREFW